jgi:hypothetical protein
MIKNYKIRALFLGFLAGLVAPSSVFAATLNLENSFGGGDVIFAQEAKLSDVELDDLRGGFVMSNGTIIDFAFTSTTFLDGKSINEVSLDSLDPSSLNNDALKSIVQIGSNNKVIESGSLPNAITIIQNSHDDVKIQQFNVLDLAVENFGNFVRQQIVPELNFQSSVNTGL